MTGLVTETCYPDILTGSSMEGGKPGLVRPCDCHSARQSRRGHIVFFGGPGAASAAHLHESASAGLWMGVSTPKQPEAVDKFENICHVVQTEQHRYPIHGKLVER